MRPKTGFGARLKALREAASLTLAELATSSGMHPQALVKLERGEREPQWASVIALARALGIATDAFLGEEEKPPAEPDPPPAPPRRRKPRSD